MADIALPVESSLIDELQGDLKAMILLQIARRADELVRITHGSPGLNRVYWLLAEEELIGHPQGAPLGSG